MKKVLTVTAAILLCAVGAIAQETPDSAGTPAAATIIVQEAPAEPVAATVQEAPAPEAPAPEAPAPETPDSTVVKPQEYAKDFVGVNFTFTNIWIMLCALLVFIMGLGFALLESGLTRAKNTTNILFKNLVTPAIGVTTYAILGFNLMYPGDAWIIKDFFGLGPLLGFGGFGLPGVGDEASFVAVAGREHYTYLTDFLFQSMFAATAATIVSGAVAERIKLHSYLVFTVIYVAFVYPFVGSWMWGGGWLSEKGFHDLAGSTLVHSVGGWGALAGAIVLGPRIGRYIGGKAKAMPGHNLTFATIGVFILWFGWWGFNGGSALSSSPKDTAWILVTTNVACVCGILGSMLTSWFIQKKPDLTMVLNGALAGLVAITAPADVVSVPSAAIIGAIAGILVVFSVFFFDKVKIDDPVGAISVHLVCGIWGTIAVGIFGVANSDFTPSVITQLIGVLAYGAFCFPAALLIFYGIKKTIGLRVSEREELRGLDLGEHGQEAYSGFQIFSNT